MKKMLRAVAIAAAGILVCSGWGNAARAQQPAPTPPPAAAPQGANLGAGTETGIGTFQTHCMGCHGPGAQGVPGKVPPLATTLVQFMRSPAAPTAQVTICHPPVPVTSAPSRFANPNSRA